jgi:ubiquinone/menaquinone biosynthesis C-methylase UbiE
MIAKARENIAAAGLTNVEVRKGHIEDLPVESSSADWLISNCVINLSPEKPKVFAEIARVLKPGGQMLVSDIVAQDLPAWVRENEMLYTSCVAGAISEAEYLDGLRQVGLENVVVRERLVYDAEQLQAFLMSDLADTNPDVGNWVSSLDDESISKMTESVAGKVWSVMVHARKKAS